MSQRSANYQPSHPLHRITAKLVELGYTEKDFPSYDRNWERLMASRGELTEKCEIPHVCQRFLLLTTSLRLGHHTFPETQGRARKAKELDDSA